ncbi:hypothetical protein PR048_016456 [Dryococelus australis]|uniref:Uncharacterized protein n=1 Tax=Dryococelus australis TaxID=614101 RepID=A0ABQ9HJS9_9NEOP|nr:hypothetical protein PR048_016456 [Dryococelus australis]
MSRSKYSNCKKRTIESEHRVFQKKHGNLLICALKAEEYNLRGHYETHCHKYNQYHDKSREDKVRDLKTALGKQQSLFENSKGDGEEPLEFIKQCLGKTAEIVCREKVQNSRNISLSRNTIVERVDDIARNLNEQLPIKAESFVAFSIAVDESTDVIGEVKVSVFIRTCDNDLNIIEELLGIVSLQNTTPSEDTFEEVYHLLEWFNLPLSKLVCVATDGAPSMMGKCNGFVARLLAKQKEVSPESKLHHIRCITHQEVLRSKTVQLEHVLKYAKKVVSFIRSRGLNQRDVGSECEGLPCHMQKFDGFLVLLF